MDYDTIKIIVDIAFAVCVIVCIILAIKRRKK